MICRSDQAVGGLADTMIAQSAPTGGRFSADWWKIDGRLAGGEENAPIV